VVNAPGLAAERGIALSETKSTAARDYTDLIRVVVVSGRQEIRVAGTLVGHRNRPHLLEAWGQRFDLQLEDSVALFRYRDMPGMIGRVGTILGERGINVISAAVGRTGEGGGEEDGRLAVMAITTDQRVPDEVLAEIAGGEGFVAGRAVSL